jgi:hypothetical protein
MRHVVAHLALTGGMAASDSLIQQMLGHGITAKLSAKLGEGLLNGCSPHGSASPPSTSPARCRSRRSPARPVRSLARTCSSAWAATIQSPRRQLSSRH